MYSDKLLDNELDQKPDRFSYDFKISKDPEKKRWLNFEAQITHEDGTVEDYIDGGRNEMAIMQRFQAKLAELGSRKNRDETSNYILPTGEIRDSINELELLQELR